MLSRLKNTDFKRLAAILFCAGCAVAVLFLLLRYALGIFLPFIIALILAASVDRPANILSKRLGLSKRLCSILLLLLLLVLLSAVITLILQRLLSESQRLLYQLAKGDSGLGDAISALFDRVSSIGDKALPIFDRLMSHELFAHLAESIDSTVESAISSTVSSLTESLTSFFIGFFSSLPGSVLFISVTLIASFYLCADYDKIKKRAFALLPIGIASLLLRLKNQLRDSAAAYLRAYLLLFMLTFIQLLVGFSILGTPYPLLLALLVALLDLLPVFGVGAVLVPWGLAELILFGDMYVGMGLLILYVIVIVIRQITEPKVVSDSLGLHPLITLIAMYVGFRLIGVLGMIVGPVAATVGKAVIRAASTDTVDKIEGL